MIALIGATGFTGRRIIRELTEVRQGEELVAIVRPSSDRALVDRGLSVRVADLSDTARLRSALTGARIVVYAASLGFGNALTAIAAIEQTGPERALFFSSTAIFTQLSAASKTDRLAGEELILKSTLAYTIFRPTMIYGRPGDRNIERLLRLVARAPVFPVIGPGTGLQQPVHVDDLARAVRLALETPDTVGRSYNLAGPTAMTFTAMVRAAMIAVGRERPMVHLPSGAVATAARIWAHTSIWPHLKPEQVARIEEDKGFDPQPAVDEFGFVTRDFSLGVAEEAQLLGLRPPSALTAAADPGD